MIIELLWTWQQSTGSFVATKSFFAFWLPFIFLEYLDKEHLLKSFLLECKEQERVSSWKRSLVKRWIKLDTAKISQIYLLLVSNLS